MRLTETEIVRFTAATGVRHTVQITSKYESSNRLAKNAIENHAALVAALEAAFVVGKDAMCDETYRQVAAAIAKARAEA